MRGYDYLEATHITENKQAILEALKGSGVERVDIHYSGSGDSGCIEDIAFSPVSPPDDARVKVEQFTSHWEDGKWIKTQRTLSLSISSAIENLCYDLLSDKHCGWENNDGADGDFSLDVATGALTWNHNENVVTQTTFNYSY